ncbi:MAG: class I SAM-dependent methyltransferase [Comamonas sp.]
MTIPCPLCGSRETEILEKLDVDCINRAYKKLAGLDGLLMSRLLAYCRCGRCGLLFFEPMQTGDELLYERLQAFDWYYLADKPEYGIARKYLPKNGKVLDVGAGTAAFSRQFEPGLYTGLEFNDQAIEKAGREGINLLKQSIEEHARSGRKYDAVVSFQVLEHVAAPASFIRSSLECLHPGGLLVLAVPAQDGFAGVALNNTLNMPPHHVTHWPESTLRNLAPKFGVKVLAVEFEPIAGYHLPWARKTI